MAANDKRKSELKHFVVHALLPSGRDLAHYRRCFELCPGIQLRKPDDAAACNHLELVQHMHANGNHCTARGADRAAARGLDEMGALLARLGVPCNYQPLMDFFHSTSEEEDGWVDREYWGSEVPVAVWFGVTTDQARNVMSIVLRCNMMQGACF